MTTYTIEVRIPEDTADELIHRAVNGSLTVIAYRT